MKILVAEDNLADRLIIRRHLQSMLHDVILAQDGQEAIDLFKKEDPELVLLDVRMPGMDGYATIQKIRSLDLEWRPILFLSSHTEPEAFVAGIKAGADDYLYKPINRDVLEAKLIAMERIVAMRKQLITVTAELAWETEKAQQIANLDGLTGLANRRYLNHVLEQEIRRAAREKQPITVIMIDIDFFKHYNDHFGHLAGDDVLRKVAKLLQGSVNRAADLVSRFGGEEFCIVLPNTASQGGMEIAEELRKTVQEARIPHADGLETKWLTISLGVSCQVPGADTSLDEIIHVADQALYQAKASGRNRVSTL
ncbi:MAG: diguanylate cyclase [Pseudomonadota bacterium]